MKKVICFILIVFMVSFPMMAKAVSYGYSNVTGSSFSIRTAPTTSASVIGYLYGGVNVDITETAHGNGCGTWYRVNFNNSTGWVCGITNGGSRNVELYTTNTLRTNNREPQTDYERQLSSAGFPSSYWDKLTALHNVHPNWNFVANQTGRDWAYATWAETGAVSDGDDDKSLLYAYNGDTNIIAGYLKTDNYNYKNNTFNMKDSGGFYAARQEMVAYYMDPRNFLNENFIFQFETLSYNSTYHTADIVSNIFGGGYLNRYATNYVSAGRAKGVSPVHMATRSVQEGTNRDYFLTNGSAFTYDGSYYPSIVGHVFSNCFNFFNIGAYSDTRNAAHNAGVYACGGPNRNDLTYGRPWNTVDKALLGGAEILAGGYVSAGQDTLYFQKYNTASYTRTDLYGHQYMSNIAAVAYEGSDTYDSYKDAGVINQAFTFVIPVYNNMPEKTYLPSSLSPNNYLKSLKVDGVEVPSFDGDRTSGYRIIVPNTKSSINITADPVVYVISA